MPKRPRGGGLNPRYRVTRGRGVRQAIGIGMRAGLARWIRRIPVPTVQARDCDASGKLAVLAAGVDAVQRLSGFEALGAGHHPLAIAAGHRHVRHLQVRLKPPDGLRRAQRPRGVAVPVAAPGDGALFAEVADSHWFDSLLTYWPPRRGTGRCSCGKLMCLCRRKHRRASAHPVSFWRGGRDKPFYHTMAALAPTSPIVLAPSRDLL